MKTRVLLNIAIAMLGWMLAVWARLFLPFGASLGDDYIIWPHMVTFINFGAIFVAYGLSTLTSNNTSLYKIISPQRQFRVLILGTLIAISVITIFLPDISGLQLVYFSFGTFFVGFMTIVLPDRYRRTAHQQIDIMDNLTALYQKRGLLSLWLRYRIEDRYSQTILGILWIVLLPLSTSLVLAFAFGTLLGARSLPNGVSYVVFLLSGITIFGIFRDVILKSKGSILSQTGIIGRVYFPREIIIILLIGEAFIDFLFVFVTLIAIELFQGSLPNLHFLLLPIPVFIMVILTTGLAFFVSWYSLVVRDFQQLLTVVMQLLFYVVVLFTPERAPADVAVIINAIPLTPIIVAFRDIIIYDRTPDMISLYYPLILGITFLYFGYVYFKVNEDRFMDFV